MVQTVPVDHLKDAPTSRKAADSIWLFEFRPRDGHPNLKAELPRSGVGYMSSIIMNESIGALSSCRGAALLVAASFICSAAGSASAADYYSGHMYVYERVQTHTSAAGGRVVLLRPGGDDMLHDANDSLLIEGPLTGETVAVVRRLISETERIDFIFLDSRGGLLSAGMSLGRIFRKAAKTIVVQTEPFKAEAKCASACALAFLGGKARIVLTSPDGIGFHRQFKLTDGARSYGDEKADKVQIARYLADIGATGVTADEIVETKGLVTFSEAALHERGITTISRAKFKDAMKTVVGFTGASGYELLRAACGVFYDPVRVPEDFDHFDRYMRCFSNGYAFREPVVRLVYLSELTTDDIDIAFLDMKRGSAQRESFDRRYFVPTYKFYLEQRTTGARVQGFLE